MPALLERPTGLTILASTAIAVLPLVLELLLAKDPHSLSEAQRLRAEQQAVGAQRATDRGDEVRA
jgi:hypothetical protein